MSGDVIVFLIMMGGMLFGLVCIVIGEKQKDAAKKDLDKQAEKYLKHLKDIEEDILKEERRK